MSEGGSERTQRQGETKDELRESSGGGRGRRPAVSEAGTHLWVQCPSPLPQNKIPGTQRPTHTRGKPGGSFLAFSHPGTIISSSKINNKKKPRISLIFKLILMFEPSADFLPACLPPFVPLARCHPLLCFARDRL